MSTLEGGGERYVNGQIVAVKWVCGDYATKKAGHDFITQVSTWDGERYRDPYFCNGEHAKRFAYAAANSGHAMPAYFEALRDQKARAAK
ncbi:hypothetical protein [Mesorhizobium sp. L-8-10]|uniref:hypothetical protein n=1 Tax=Mesorhizobium sp. L-8-10 TaxID=2744523 RepID=UPI0019259E57|nr:hypothetical protein [Mesorhizobium sp. L-8-10]